MNIYYAIGGGLGHLTRGCAFLRQFGLENETAILTSSKFSSDRRIVGNIKIISVDDNLSLSKTRFRTFLNETFRKLECRKVYLDAFPFGILGEFVNFDFREIELFYVARILNWHNYQNRETAPAKQFSKTFVVENLDESHLEFIRRNSTAVENLDLIYHAQTAIDQNLLQKIIKSHAPFWLVVHGGSDEETKELVAFAREIRDAEKATACIVVVSPNKFDIENAYDIYPASVLFPFAEKIITACGFNVMKQTADFRRKHFFLPFERRFDDQFLRAKNARHEYAEQITIPDFTAL